MAFGEGGEEHFLDDFGERGGGGVDGAGERIAAEGAEPHPPHLRLLTRIQGQEVVVEHDHHAIAPHDRPLGGKVERHDRNLLEVDVLPDVELRPVGEREDADAFVFANLRVVEAPELRPLVFRIPAVELVAKRKHPLLGPALFFVAAGTAEGGVEPILVERLPQGLRLHDVGVDLAAVGDRIDAGRPALFVDMHDQLEAQLLGDIGVAHAIHFLKLPGRIDVHQREGGLGRVKSLLGKANHHGRILADRVEHHRVFKLGGHLTDDVDALGFELTKMGEIVGGHAWPNGKLSI